MIIKSTIKKLKNTGFFSIVISNALTKIVAFLGGTVLVRILSKSDYGVYSYVMNAIGILVILGDMGTGMATLQFTQENYGNELKFKGYCAYGLKLTMLFSLLPMICILLSPFFYPFVIEEAKVLVLYLSALPFVNNLNTFFQTNLRAHTENKKLSALNVLTVVIHYAVLLPMSLRWGVIGAVLANYGFGTITILIAIYFNKNLLYIGNKYHKAITRIEKKQFIKLSVPSQMMTMVSQVMLLIDVFMVGLFFKDKEIIASYKIATTIPAACNFIPSSVMIYAIPYFSRNKQNPSWIKKNYKVLLIVSSSLCFLIAFTGITTASWMIPLLFGEGYKDAIACYVILLIGFIFSGGVQIPSVNVIYTQRKVGVNLIITIVSGGLNVLLDIVGIKFWGSLGAAMATTSVHIIGSAMAFVYMKMYLLKRCTERI